MELSYLTYGSQAADTFVIQFRCRSFDELKIIPVMSSILALKSDFHPITIREAGRVLVTFMAGVSDYTVVDVLGSALLVAGQQAFSKSFPFAWVRSSGLSGDFEIQVVFAEGGPSWLGEGLC